MDVRHPEEGLLARVYDGYDASLGVWGVGQPETVSAGTRFNRHALLARQTGRYDADDMAKGLSIYTYIHSHEFVG